MAAVLLLSKTVFYIKAWHIEYKAPASVSAAGGGDGQLQAYRYKVTFRCNK
jgi:hypothetical protein